MTLRSEVHLDPRIEANAKLLSEVGAVLVYQHHGQLVRVEAGWLHSVINVQHSIKIAREFMLRDRVAMYAAVPRLISDYIGPEAAHDYMPLQVCAHKTLIMM